MYKLYDNRFLTRMTAIYCPASYYVYIKVYTLLKHNVLALNLLNQQSLSKVYFNLINYPAASIRNDKDRYKFIYTILCVRVNDEYIYQRHLIITSKSISD